MGSIVTNPPTNPNLVSDSWQPLLDVTTMSHYGMNKITLDNWDETTDAPLIKQGSAIDINGSVARFFIDESIGDPTGDGIVYLKFIVSASLVSAEWTLEAPTWYADKAGWYNATGERYSGHFVTKTGIVYTLKKQWINNGPATLTLSPGNNVFTDGVYTDNFAFKVKVLTGTRAGFDSGVAHGLDSTKIITAIASAQYSNNEWYGFPQDTSFENRVHWNSTIVDVTGLSTGYTAMKVIIFYEA